MCAVRCDVELVIIQVSQDEDKARTSLAWYRRRKIDDSSIDDEMKELDAEKERAMALAAKPYTLKQLFGKRLRRPLFIAMFLQVDKIQQNIVSTL